MVVYRGYYWTIHPRLHFIIEKRSTESGKMITLFVIQKFLKLEIGKPVSSISSVVVC